MNTETNQTTRRFFNLTAHPSSAWSPNQRSAALAMVPYGVIQDVSGPHHQIDPHATPDAIDALAYRLVNQLNPRHDDVFLVGGELSFTLKFIEALKATNHCVIVCATTERVSIDRQQPDGTTKKESTFAFATFRRLT
jgi:hypothetical protein